MVLLIKDSYFKLILIKLSIYHQPLLFLFSKFFNLILNIKFFNLCLQELCQMLNNQFLLKLFLKHLMILIKLYANGYLQLLQLLELIMGM